MDAVAEGEGGEARELAGVAVGEGNGNAVGGEVSDTRKGVSGKARFGLFTVRDVGSLNGTYVNRGNRLIPGTPLEIKADDEVIIGKTFLKLVVDPIS